MVVGIAHVVIGLDELHVHLPFEFLPFVGDAQLDPSQSLVGMKHEEVSLFPIADFDGGIGKLVPLPRHQPILEPKQEVGHVGQFAFKQWIGVSLVKANQFPFGRIGLAAFVFCENLGFLGALSGATAKIKMADRVMEMKVNAFLYFIVVDVESSRKPRLCKHKRPWLTGL
jgi:hypothetical protein